jgi:cobyrinic acid a,c-diamide synthase
VATGLLAALRRRGHTVASAKVGPDFIDPGYHSLASGRPPRNLDVWLCGADAIGPLAGRAAAGADVLVVEGVMGLFDGAADGGPTATADVAKLLDAPVVLVVDASALSTSVAALVAGYAGFDPALRTGGVILNRVGSPGHELLLREALEPLGIPVPEALGRLADAIAAGVDLEAVVRLAASAPERTVGPVTLPEPVVGEGPSAQGPVRVAVAAGAAFTFTYQDTLDALVAAGVEPVPFDPRVDPALPDGVAGLLAGGGFPEVHAADLAANEPLLADVRRHAAAGLPIWAECGGLLWLCRSLDGTPMAGVVPADARMTERLTLGYRTAQVAGPSPIADAGDTLRGHEFHYSAVEPAGDALTLTSRWVHRTDGFASPTRLATYLHHHPGGDPHAVGRFAATCAAHAR